MGFRSSEPGNRVISIKVVISQKSNACQSIVARKTRVGMVRVLTPNAASLSENARGVFYNICSHSCFPCHFLLVSRAF